MDKCKGRRNSASSSPGLDLFATADFVHLGAADRANTGDSRPAVLHRDVLRVFDLPHGAFFHAIALHRINLLRRFSYTIDHDCTIVKRLGKYFLKLR